MNEWITKSAAIGGIGKSILGRGILFFGVLGNCFHFWKNKMASQIENKKCQKKQ